jgi:ketosteroid isomerase-like protein
MADRLDQLEARLVALEEKEAVLATLNAYGHAIDYGDEERWLDCFAEDGVFEVVPRLPGHAAMAYSGKSELAAFIAHHSRAPVGWHKHVIVEPVVDISGSTAGCDCYFVVLQDHEGGPLLRVFGRYRDRLKRGEDGVWRFLVRRCEVESMWETGPPLADAVILS